MEATQVDPPPVKEARPLPAKTGAPPGPQAVLMLAVEKGTAPEVISKMMDLQERWEANEAKKAYVRAMAAFKQEAPPVLAKDATVDFTSSKGRTHYRHTTLGSIVIQITSIMGRHGLSASWSTAQNENGGVTVTCHITHELGHSEGVTLTAPPDASGNKNLIQQVGSTVTYLQRYTLLAALGLATADQDDDGVKAGERIEDHDSAGAPSSGEGAAASEIPPDASENQPPAPAPKCPKCGADAIDQRGQTGKTGKKLPAFKCSTGRYNRETKKTEGCDWTEWDEKFFEKQVAAKDAQATERKAQADAFEKDVEKPQQDAPAVLMITPEQKHKIGEYARSLGWKIGGLWGYIAKTFNKPNQDALTFDEAERACKELAGVVEKLANPARPTCPGCGSADVELGKNPFGWACKNEKCRMTWEEK